MKFLFNALSTFILLLSVNSLNAAIPVVQDNLISAGQNKIDNYKICFAVCDYSGKNMIIIREFEQSGQACYIGIDPFDLKTLIIPAAKVKARLLSWKQIMDDYSNTPYIRAIRKSSRNSDKLQDAGIVHGFTEENGITLTVDLCPSRKPLDREIFTSLISEFGKTEKPVPLALSVTGKFMLTHPEDMDWIKGLISAGDISVTWINHTYNHRYNPQKPLNENFLLEPGTSMDFEILQTEIALLQRGLLFSVFFRFPGLVSNQQSVDTINDYGLIPIGTDAWLAKGQPAYKGSIVLIHGNGNEPLGIKDFLHLLKTKRSAVMRKSWLLYDLSETIESEFIN